MRTRYEHWTIKSSKKSKPYSTKLEVDGKFLQMEIDTRASLTLIPEKTFRSYWRDADITESTIVWSSYNGPGELSPVLGTIDVCVKYSNQETTLPLLVVKGDRPSLLGRNWLEEIRLNRPDLFWLHYATLNELLEKHTMVVGSDVGTAKGFKARITIQSSAAQRFLRVHSVPYFY